MRFTIAAAALHCFAQSLQAHRVRCGANDYRVVGVKMIFVASLPGLAAASILLLVAACSTDCLLRKAVAAPPYGRLVRGRLGC